MAVNYDVAATVIDIRSDQPKDTDVFLVDTNVWFWLSYSRASLGDTPPANYQLLDYPTFINKATSVKAKLVYSGLSFAELAHLVEKVELEIYSQSTGFDKRKKKEFRHHLVRERANVISETEIAWAQIEVMGIPIDVNVDDALVRSSLNRLKTLKLDGYDVFNLETISRAGVLKVLTDDGDFATVPGIQVFTSNRNVLHLAMAKNKIVKR